MKKNYAITFNYSILSKSFKVNTLAMFIGLVFLGMNSVSAQTYCLAAATSTVDDEVFNVTLGALNNTSSCGSVGGAGSIAYKYNNYTATVPAPALTIGGNYPLSVTIGMCGTFGYSGTVGVWIDYNQNGLFTDPGENVYMSPYTSFAIAGTVVSAVGGITIPATALPGTTRMRVVETESSTAPGPCTSPAYGEVEDYNVLLITPTPLDLGVSGVLKPNSNYKCFTVDTIVTEITNYGSATADFSVNPTVITVKSSGPTVATYTLALNSGTLAPAATQDFTMTTTYNMTSMGTYTLQAFTTVAGDGSALNDTVVVTRTKKPLFKTTVSPNDTVCLGVPVQLNATYNPSKQVGAGTLTNSSTTYPAPYGNWYGGARHQFLFTAAELQLAGLTAGNINTLAFDAVNLNSTIPLDGFQISMGTTTITSLTAFQSTPLTNCYSTVSYTPTLGINTHTFSTVFNWNGIDNILVETCFNDLSNFSSNVSFNSSLLPFTASVWYSADSDPTVCTSTVITSSSTRRPNMYFGQPTVVNYTWTPATELSASNIANPIANLSGSKTYTITANIAGCTSYDTIHIHVKSTPNPHLGNDTTICTPPFSLNANTPANIFLWNTGASSSTLVVNATGKYWVRGTNSNGCSLTDTIKVTVGTLPIVTLGADTAYCAGSTIHLYCGNAGSTILWNTGANTPFITVGTTGTYSVLVTNASGCKSSDAINVTSKPKPTVGLVFTGQTHFCPTVSGRPLTEGTPAGGTYIGSGVSGNTFNATTAGQGTYIIMYSYTGPNGCSNTAKDTLVVDACVGIDELTSDLGLNAYPNPNTGEFTFEISSSADITGNISVMSIDGRVVYKEAVNGNGLITQTINITDLANGIYYLRLETKEAIRTYKVLKQ
jgi:hypothetical protein